MRSYLSVLNAETQVLTARQAMVDINTQQAVARVTLLLALGGSFDPSVSSKLASCGPLRENVMSTSESTVRTESSAAAPAATPKGRARRLGLLGLAAVVILSALGYGGYWFLDGRFYESTDDAYVNGDVVQVTSEVPGTVLALHVDDTQAVTAGQPLLELDPADAKVAEANAEADLARAVRQVRGLFAQGQELRAQIDNREQARRTADEDLERRNGLLADGAISGEELSHARDAVTTTRANVAAAREQLSQTISQIDGTTIADHPQVLSAAAAVRNAALALHRTELSSPVSGVVAKRSVQVGQRVAAGTPRCSPWCRSMMCGWMPTSRKCSWNACAPVNR